MESLLEVFACETKAIRYLFDNRVLQEENKCSRCRKFMQLYISKKSWKYRTRSCRKELSIFKKTFVGTSRVPVNKTLQLSYLFLMGMPVNGLVEATGLSSKTVSDWVKFIRQLLGDPVDFDDTVIGGTDIVVEIDETKLGKRKYHRGHRVDGVWVVAGFERTPEKRCFAVEVDNRDAPTMCRILSEYVRPGSIIHTNTWKAYKNPCIELGFDQKTVNHSVTFKDAVTSVHTNTIKGLNNGLKSYI
ncbi:hypothetical protein RF11_11263 [Thelohanellus kitauei]|uniref:ISXO2-like transposase domain-containing protein n=1 Tax=Thelohanellus kitauei TaxID=669202 RepID=A0A0C2I7J5_THEKT|nr:hypothetical protein RF11_11263 [Thelohanellus kitauei]